MIGRRRLAVNRPARYDTASHGGARPRAADLGGGSRPRPGEGGGHSARRCRRGARPAPAACNRRHHCGDDGPRCRGEARHSWLRRRAPPATRLYRRRIRRWVPRNGVPAAANAHLDPAHVAALEAAVAQNQRENGTRIVFPDVTKRPWALRLTEEFRSGACHAGRYESSIVLAARPELVRDAIRRALPSNPRSLSAAIRSGQTSFEEAGGPRAYFGSPADAGADEGVRTIEILGAILAEAVLAELPG